MSWRQGYDIYLDVINAIDKHDMDDEHRRDLKAELLAVFLYNDVDPVAVDDDPVIGPIYNRLVEIKAELRRQH